MDKKNIHLDGCIECGAQCCRHIAMHIEKPACKRDYDNIRWFLMHENVHVFVDHENDWLVEFKAPCSHLRPDHTCDVYERRPNVCRDYPPPDEQCEYGAHTETYKIQFTSAAEFEKYLTKRGVDWQWKSSR